MGSKIVFQGVTEDSHLTSVQELLSIPNPTRVIISTAFMNKAGLLQLSTALTPLAAITTILAGVRNGITSAQGLQAAVESGCTTYAVDTGSRQTIFHPKLYFARSAVQARLILGSANLTIGGLNRNIEASVSMVLDLSDADDLEVADDLEKKVDDMIAEYVDHFLLLPDAAAVGVLLASGRAVDESIARPPTPGGSSGNRDLDNVPKMVLKTKPIKAPKIEQPDPAIAPPGPPPAPAAAAPPVADIVPAAPVNDQLLLVWESRPLTRRYLTIPNGANTNPTGSMLFAQGNFQGIDQRHYFRDEVFQELDWQFDTAANREHMERAVASFRLIIRDVNYGVFELRLSHNSRTDTESYAQSNSMTQLHWGPVRPLIAREDLLGRTLYLYRDESEPHLFVLEID